MLLRRIIRWILGVLVVFVVAATTTIWAYRGEILYWMTSPQISHAEMTPIPGPKYFFPETWAARPDFDSLGLLIPPGATPVAEDPLVDVFYIHPNAYWGNDWNAHFDDPDMASLVDGPLLTIDLTAFNGCCRVFAPRYRQAHGVAIEHPNADGRLALDLANVDIERAFYHYHDYEQNGRPFIIVGHGQGAILAMRLLDRRVNDEAQRLDDFVAAYLIGTGVPLDRFGTNWDKIGVCESAEDTSCVVAWEAYAEGADPAQSPNVREIWYDRRWWFLNETDNLCVNPLSWRPDEIAVSADDNPGALLLDPGYTQHGGIGGTPLIDPNNFNDLPPLTAAAAGAQCRDGILFVDVAEDSVKGLSSENGNLDQQAIALFWSSIRNNVATRSAAFLKQNRAGD